MLSEIDKNDDEFDLIAASSPEPSIRPPTVFATKHRVAEVQDENGASEMAESAAAFEDSRISSLVEMGFTSSEATDALLACKNDVNEALTLLLSTR